MGRAVTLISSLASQARSRGQIRSSDQILLTGRPGRYARVALRTTVLALGLAGAGLMAMAPAARANNSQQLIGQWVKQLDQRSAELLAAPKVPATRIGYGMVLKKGDGGLVDVVAPGPVLPVDLNENDSDGRGNESFQAAAPDGMLPGSSIDGAALASPAPLPALTDEAAVLDAALSGPPPLIIQVRARSADRVGRLATRMIELGFLPAEQWTDAFNDELEQAIIAFQTSEGLMPDGKVGEATRVAADRTPQEAARLMRDAASSMRAFQKNAPGTVILVNLPSQTVTYVEKGELKFTMRAVVGRPTRQTPLLEDRVVSVTINPTWTVPPTVMAEDKLPNLRKKGSSGIKDATVYLDGQEVAPQTVNWWKVTPERIRIVQRPGDDNALGRFRFNLTNGESIFLHGTNDARLFERDMRAASSGCVRLEDARLMADTLLKRGNVSTAAIDSQLQSGQTRTISLGSSVPVRFVYWTASVQQGGVVRVHPGIYSDIPSSTGTAPPPSPGAKPTRNAQAASKQPA